jgi:hypothetical protein
MSYDNHSYRILCEDKHQYYLIYSYLLCKGVKGRSKIALYEELPEGKGDAKQFIREYYEQALREIKKNPQTILIVVRDADNETYEDAAKEFVPAANNMVFVVIPKRNIETWFYFIDHQDDPASNDENTDRKNNYRKLGSTKYGKRLEDVINIRRNNNPTPNMPDSLDKTISALLSREKLK